MNTVNIANQREVDVQFLKLFTTRHMEYHALTNIADALIEKGANINAGWNSATPHHYHADGITALMLASSISHLPGRAEYLVKKGIDIDAQDDAGNTALIHAARHGRIETLVFLLKKDADITLKNNSGETVSDIISAQPRKSSYLMALLADRQNSNKAAPSNREAISLPVSTPSLKVYAPNL